MRTAAIAVVIAALAWDCGAPASNPADGRLIEIIMDEFSFSPRTLMSSWRVGLRWQARGTPTTGSSALFPRSLTTRIPARSISARATAYQRTGVVD